jgi:hypothetical protein
MRSDQRAAEVQPPFVPASSFLPQYGEIDDRECPRTIVVL